MRRCALVAASLVAGLLGAVPARADAAVGPRFALDPLGSASDSGYFKFRSPAGGRIDGRVRVANLGGRTGLVRLYPVDATTGATTGAVYRDVADPRRGVGAWTRLQRGAVRLAPGESAIVGFTTRVPAGTGTGDHLGGIVIEDASQREAKVVRRGRGKFRIRIRKLTIIALEVRVPGPRVAGMALTSLRAGGDNGRQSLLLGLRNVGNVLVKGSGRLTVTDSHGAPVQDRRFPIDTFVPGTAVELPVRVRGRRALGDGDYRGVAVVRYAKRTVRRTFDFSISKKSVRQVFGTQPSPIAPLTDSPLLTILAAAGVGIGGFALAALLFGRRASRKERHRRRDGRRGGAGPAEGRAPVTPPPAPRAQPRTRAPRSRMPRTSASSRSRTRTPEEREQAWRERQANRQRHSRV